MKKLYEFTVTIDGEVESIETKTENGQEITVKTKKKEKIPHKFVLKELARRENDDFRFFYGAQIKKAIDQGLLTEGVLMNKYIESTGSLLSEETLKRVVKLNKDIEIKKQEILDLVKEEQSDSKEKKEIDLFTEFNNLNVELNSIYNSTQTIFSNTAEAYAKEKSNLWLILFLTHIEKNGKLEPFFKGKTFTEKEDYLFELEEKNDPLFTAASQKLIILWTSYASGKIATEEDFKTLEQTIDEEILKKETF